MLIEKGSQVTAIEGLWARLESGNILNIKHISVILQVPRYLVVHFNIMSSFIENIYEVINVGQNFEKKRSHYT